MSGSLQRMLAYSTPEAAKDLEEAFLRIPEEKRNWCPMGKARTALDIMAECALLSDPTDIVKTRTFPSDFDFAAYARQKAEMTKDWEAIRTLLHENVSKGVATAETVPDEDLRIEIAFPWGPIPIAGVISYPYWNLSYHLGQINYLASMLGTLEPELGS